jgi:hypothetical protein
VKGERESSIFYSRHRTAKRISSYVQQNHVDDVTKLMDGDFHIWYPVQPERGESKAGQMFQVTVT